MGVIKINVEQQRVGNSPLGFSNDLETNSLGLEVSQDFSDEDSLQTL